MLFMIVKFRATVGRFSPKFWVVVGSSFIDSIGGTMVFPFFSLYITEKFDVGMTEAGVILGLFSVFGFIGGIIGGALTDRFGRRGIVLFGLVFSAGSSIAFGVVDRFTVFYFLAVFVGLLSDVAGPAYNAMVADILPEEQRAEGYGILRVVRNLSWVIGPTIGGLLISYSYLYIFIADAITSLIVAAIFFRLMPETKPERAAGEPSEGLIKTFAGYFQVARDGLFFAFVIAMVFNLLAYQQIYSTLPVFLRDVHALPERGYGYLMSANAFLVVLAQFWITARVSKRKPMQMLALGGLFYLVGLTMYGYVSTFPFFLAAMLVITVGEMVMMPVSQAMTARFAPEHMRGRYMAFFSLAWVLPSTIGPWGAGMILDNFNPSLLWYLCGISCLVAISLFLLLNDRVERRAAAQPAEV
jgi:MFS family permease